MPGRVLKRRKLTYETVLHRVDMLNIGFRVLAAEMSLTCHYVKRCGEALGSLCPRPGRRAACERVEQP